MDGPRRSGHRRIATAWFLKYRPLKRPYSEIEALISIDLDMAQGGLKSVLAYSKIFGHSRNWCRTRIGQYMDTLDALKIREKDASVDTSRTPLGHRSDTHRTPTKIQNKNLDPEEEKERESPPASRASCSSPRKKANGKAKRTAFPEPFPSEQRKELLRWGEPRGYSAAQVDYALQSVADWAVSNGKLKLSWLRAVQGAIRDGWALKGFGLESREARLARISREVEEEEASHGN